VTHAPPPACRGSTAASAPPSRRSTRRTRRATFSSSAAGGRVTIRLADAVGIDAAAKLGVFGNNGIVDETNYDGEGNYVGGSGVARNPPELFVSAGSAQVSVSSDGILFVPVGGVRTFANPTNGFTDNDIVRGDAPLGQQPADPFKPFNGTLADFGGLRYRDAGADNDIVRMLDGSAGGTWVDLSGVPLPSVAYVRFNVPEGGRFVIDAVTAVPEPASLGVIGFAAMLLSRRRAPR
jgi:hypothetical protein